MRWVRISIETSRESEDALSDLLMEMGSGGVQIEEERSACDKVVVIAYFPADDTTGERVSMITEFLGSMQELGIDVGAGRISLKNVDEQDWTENWKEFFTPLPIGERMLVAPSWEDVSEYPSRDILIKIDPGMAFGTGRHSTTILCLELLECILRGGEKVADVGTGSGILAVASVKLGAGKVVAIDVDARAAVAARENSRRNGVGDRIHVVCGELLNAVRGEYDVIVSNISSKVIIPMIPGLRSHLSLGGRLILSGILGRELSDMRGQLENNGLMILQTRLDEEWAAVLARSNQK